MAGRTQVGVVQMTSTGDVEANCASAERMIRRGADEGAKLVVVPECFAYLGPEAGKLAIAETITHESPGPILGRFLSLASELDVELVLGGFWEVSPRTSDAEASHVRNACIHVTAEGKVASVYRKIHLFDVDLPDGTKLLESETVEPGVEPIVADTRIGKLGLSVCYDLRFPALYRRLVDAGATSLAIPAAFTLTTGKDHWHVLLRARAIENQCYVLAAAQFGHHYGKRVSYGHALIADPWGTVLAECGDGENVAVATVDADVVARVRRAIPCLTHRRL